jgi:hypothetical protein
VRRHRMTARGEAAAVRGRRTGKEKIKPTRLYKD